MNTQPFPRMGFIAALMLLPLFGACTDGDLPTAGHFPQEPAFSNAPLHSQGEPLKVMTRNMYLGGDVNPLFLAAAVPNPDPTAIASAAHAVWSQIHATNFPERATALAREIALNQPHIVGIQEIPSFEFMAGPTGPVMGEQDHLDILMMALAEEPYAVARVQENTSATFPIVISQQLLYIRFIDRIAVLVRNDMEVADVASATYAARVPLIPGEMEAKRGWIRVSAEFGGIPYHFVNTHLEVQRFASVQDYQVQELLGSVLPGLDGVTVLMGDLNSDAENGPGAPSYTPTYETLLAAGFLDTWEMANPGMPDLGFTCCQEPLLTNPTSVLDERIDFVLLRSSGRNGWQNRAPGSIHVEIVGDSPATLTPSGLWPADHAGLLASLKLAPGVFMNP